MISHGQHVLVIMRTAIYTSTAIVEKLIRLTIFLSSLLSVGK